MPDPNSEDQQEHVEDTGPVVPEEDPAEAEKRARRAALAFHPHTQLRGILTELASPAARSSDITTKYATLHAAVTRLVQQVLQHTPPPDDSEEKINEDIERKQRPAEGADA